MILLEVHVMLAVFIGIKWSRSTLISGMRMSMPIWVSYVAFQIVCHWSDWTGIFYFNHYRAALDDIKVLEAELSKVQEELALTPADFQQYLEDEKWYLNNLKKPCPTVSRKIKYIQVLMDLDRYQYILLSQGLTLNTSDYDI